MAMCEQLKQRVIDGADGAALTEALLMDGVPAQRLLDEALTPAMDLIGERMRTGAAYIPEVIAGARAMKDSLRVLRPRLVKDGGVLSGTVVIGTVEGDLHDIGKNLVAIMLEGNGFEVVDLGTGVTAAAFAEAVGERGADVLGMSALLTTMIGRMRDTITALREAGLRERVKVIVGGAPITQEYADAIGADGYGANAATAVEVVKSLVRGAS